MKSNKVRSLKIMCRRLSFHIWTIHKAIIQILSKKSPALFAHGAEENSSCELQEKEAIQEIHFTAALIIQDATTSKINFKIHPHQTLQHFSRVRWGLTYSLLLRLLRSGCYNYNRDHENDHYYRDAEYKHRHDSRV